MIYFILRRTFQSVLTVLGVVTFTFFLVRLAGDPTALLLPVEASDEDIARLRAALGLDQSWIVQYWKFLANAVSGDFGVSLRQRTPALDLVLERLPATLELALTSFVLGMVLAFGIGLAMRLSTSARLRSAALWLALARQAIPVFSFGLILILISAVREAFSGADAARSSGDPRLAHMAFYRRAVGQAGSDDCFVGVHRTDRHLSGRRSRRRAGRARRPARRRIGARRAARRARRSRCASSTSSEAVRSGIRLGCAPSTAMSAMKLRTFGERVGRHRHAAKAARPGR